MSIEDTLARAFTARRFQLWLVGGALRDGELGRPSPDRDYATDALPDQIEEIAAAIGVRTVNVGRRFGTIGMSVGDRWVEVTTFRGESYRDGTRWPDVTFGTSIDEDLSRRDFTMNALARNVTTGEVLDPFDGRADIHEGIIRCVGDPVRRFREDPLRILRAARFVSQLDFGLDPETAAGMANTAARMSGLSTERVAAELDRLLGGMAPGRGLRALASCGGLEAVLPELAPMRGCEQNSFHRFDVWEHTVVTVDMIAVDEGSRRLRRWAALLHDVGKPGVRHRKANGEWGFFRHETAGAEVARRLMLRLGVAKEDRLAVELVVRRHMDRPRPEDRRSVRRFMHRCRGHWEDLLALQRADNSSHTYDDSAYADALSRACREAAAKDAEALKARSPLSGDDLMALFGRKPGPWIRRVKDRLGAMVLDGDLAPDDREAAARAAAELVAEPADADGDGRRQAP